jgi:hypothetical protein
MDREGGGVPLEAVYERWRADMVDELRALAKAYVRTRKGGAELLDALALAECRRSRSDSAGGDQARDRRGRSEA